MTRRVERAAWLLRQGGSSITEVCMEVGCTLLGLFSSRFTELAGETPSAYRHGRRTSASASPRVVARSTGFTRNRSGSEKRAVGSRA